ncbi:hypothetical protein MPL1032_240310 [Mesorhizobium plurifarium]|uniref:Acyl-CoA dehydrogenase/oxidase C-terminal domain-containing protein n=1 Tax=Mesorhizobium plurifarium TaxID=69974 RepID=A0A0K2W0W9_MESPL|nr:hypothetical protein MPL1032_240310 [Mesorhizobium plurifarium]
MPRNGARETNDGFRLHIHQQEIRQVVGRICEKFGPDYWRECDETGAATLFDGGERGAREATMAKYFASEAAWEAAEAAMTTFGGYGFASAYHVECKWRETRLFRTAPISNNLVLAQVAQHILGMPRS